MKTTFVAPLVVAALLSAGPVLAKGHNKKVDPAVKKECTEAHKGDKKAIKTCIEEKTAAAATTEAATHEGHEAPAATTGAGEPHAE